MVMGLNKKEKINKLEEVSKVLKSEFIGLDNIIDQIITSISPWYVTPEVITRPVVVSLWGMTGTGKSSVIRRMIELLDLKSKSMFIDCGEVTNDNGYFHLGDRINDFINGENDGDAVDGGKDSSNIFVFDEFQYARTLDEQGCEKDKANLRPVWTLLDSGKLDYSEWMYGLGFFRMFHSDFSSFAFRYGHIPLKDCILSDPKALEDYINELGYYFYGINPLEGVVKADDSRPWRAIGEEEKKEEEQPNPYKPLNLLKLQTNIIGLVYKGMNRKGLGKGKEIIEKLYYSKTVGEFKSTLDEIASIISAPKVLDCSKSIVFIIGNLDEAFRVETDVNPDMNADIFNDITSKVTIHDIKESLGKRFRAEQIARLGNNLIKYPTLRSTHFRKIIEKELSMIFEKFERENGIKVDYGQDVIDLAYAEGVFPTQGVRPVFTTISTMLTPILSDIIVNADEGETWVNLSVMSEYPKELGYRVPDVKIRLGYGPGKDITIPLKLQLGELRYPKGKKRRFSSSVHEIGHAILNCYCTGNIPVNIVSVSTDDGGFCDTSNGSTREILNIEDTISDIRISLAGYLAEVKIFGEKKNINGVEIINKDKILLGSGSDIHRAWDKLSRSVYRLGFFNPISYGNYSIQARSPEPYPDGYQLEEKELQIMMKGLWDQCIREVNEVLESEKKLLKEAALILSEKGCIEKSEFAELIKTYGNILTEEWMEEKRNSDEWYKSRLENFE